MIRAASDDALDVSLESEGPSPEEDSRGEEVSEVVSAYEWEY